MMKIKEWTKSALAIALLGLGVLIGNVVGTGGPVLQPLPGPAPSVVVGAITPPPGGTQSAAPGNGNAGTGASTAQITPQTEQAPQAANQDSTVNDLSLSDPNGTLVPDVGATGGDGALANGDTGAVIAGEAASQGQGDPSGPGNGADPVAGAAPGAGAQAQAAQAARPSNPGDNSQLPDQNRTIARQDATHPAVSERSAGRQARR